MGVNHHNNNNRSTYAYSWVYQNNNNKDKRAGWTFLQTISFTAKFRFVYTVRHQHNIIIIYFNIMYCYITKLHTPVIRSHENMWYIIKTCKLTKHWTIALKWSFVIWLIFLYCYSTSDIKLHYYSLHSLSHTSYNLHNIEKLVEKNFEINII